MRNCFVLKADNKGRIHISILLMLVTIIILMLYMNFEKRIVVNLRDRIDNALAIGAFSGCVCDTEYFLQDVFVIKNISEEEIIYDFESMFRNTGVKIRHEEAYGIIEAILLENLQHNNVGNVLVQNAYIENLVIYNLTDILEIHNYILSDYTYKVIQNYSGENRIFTPNGIEVDKTCIYVKIGFQLSGILMKDKDLSLEKCILVEYY